MQIRPRPMIRLVQEILEELGEAEAEVGLILTGDVEIKRLNRRYRGVDRATDVLAFPMRAKSTAGDKKQVTGAWPLGLGYDLLGDVVISVPTAKRQATKAGHRLGQEMSLLIVHGLLHLLGYDHERSLKEAKRMQKIEKKLLETYYRG